MLFEQATSMNDFKEKTLRHQPVGCGCLGVGEIVVVTDARMIVEVDVVKTTEAVVVGLDR
jgi:hypothetical protein